MYSQNRLELSLSLGSAFNDLVRNFEAYDYNGIEITLLQSDNLSWNGDKLLVEHAIYATTETISKNSDTHEAQLDEISEKIKNNIGFILEDGNNTLRSEEEKVRNLLIKLDNLLEGRYYQEFLEKWFDSIYSFSKVEAVVEEENISMILKYNQFVQKNKNAESESVNF